MNDGGCIEWLADRDHGAGVFAAAWADALVGTNFLPGTRADTVDVLRRLVGRVALALAAPVFDATTGRSIGADLWSAQVMSPDGLGRTVDLFLRRLLTDLQIDDERAPGLLARLVGDLVAGFTTAVKHHAMRSAESINRAERAAWRTKQEALQNQIAHRQLHDPVTDLPNRSALARHLEEVIGAVARVGVCALHLPRVAAVRDNLGPTASDELLCDVADRLRQVNAGAGYVAQLAPDTFMLVTIDTTSSDDVVKDLHRAVRALPNPWTYGDHDIALAFTAGIVEQATGGLTATMLIRDAEVALSWAADDPRTPWVIYDGRRGRRDAARYRLTNDLPKAIATGALTLAYQPIVALPDGVTVAAEALLRWRHPTLGDIDPATVVAIATDIGLTDTLGTYVLDQACRQAAQWQRHPRRYRVSVNVTAPQLANSEFPAIVHHTLRRHHLHPRQLILEVTEEAPLEPAAVDGLRAIRNLDIHIAIDDFGTGYSNLAGLDAMPVSIVKLAAPLTRQLGAGGPAGPRTTMVDHVIALAHSLDLAVIAEGIETAAQAAILTELGCDLGQGFHLGRPTTPFQITAGTNA